MGALDAADFGDGLAPRASSTCKTMKLEDATQGKWGAYMSFGESKETGVISNRNAKFVFVKFDTDLARFGWKGTTPGACDRKDLIELLPS